MIIADLLNMRITLVSSTTLETLPIITKGKPGSYYETPVGEYEVGLKVTNILVLFGEVYMPYSVQFYANFLYMVSLITQMAHVYHRATVVGVSGSLMLTQKGI